MLFAIEMFEKESLLPTLNITLCRFLAKRQMDWCGAMMSFEFDNSIDVNTFLKSLELIKPSMSLAGVESTMLVPAETSHHLLKEEDRLKQGITNNLIRFSVGIEDTEDIIQDIEQAIVKATNK